MPYLPLRSALVGLALLAGAVGASGAAQAQDASPSHLAAARDLIQVTGALASVDDLLPAFTEQIRKQAVTRPEVTKDLDVVIKALQPEIDQQRQQALIIVSKTYTKYLTEQELRDVTAFFKTPTGSKYIRAQSELVDAVVTDIQTWSDQASEYVMLRVRAEMSKRGHQM